MPSTPQIGDMLIEKVVKNASQKDTRQGYSDIKLAPIYRGKPDHSD